jgi:hypothetical protein
MRGRRSAAGSQKTGVRNQNAPWCVFRPEEVFLGSSWVHPGFILGSSWVRPGFILGSSYSLPAFKNDRKQANSTMDTIQRKKLGPWRRNMHHRYDAACTNIIRRRLKPGLQRRGECRRTKVTQLAMGGEPQLKERKMISGNSLRGDAVQAPRGARSRGGACEGRCVARLAAPSSQLIARCFQSPSHQSYPD